MITSKVRALGCAGMVALSLAVSATVANAQTRFAVVGDYGVDNANELAVANAIKAANPSFIATTGDNTYFVGTTAAADFANWDKTQGKYYAPYIKLPTGSAYASQGASVNKFFPSIGNHDLDESYATYNTYFANVTSTPGVTQGNGLYYYSYKEGPVEIFVLTADPRADNLSDVGRSSSSAQYQWAQNAIKNSTAKWQVVTFHQPAYTYQSSHGPETAMRWPFQSWGVDAVFTGHNHNMQAMTVTDSVNNTLPFFVQGAGGQSRYAISGQPGGATGLWSNDSSFGYSMVTATDTTFKVDFLDTSNNVLYTQNVTANAGGTTPPPPPPTAPTPAVSFTLTAPTITQNFNSLPSSGNTAPPTGWRQFTFGGANTTFNNTTGIPASAIAAVPANTASTTLVTTTTPSGTQNNGFNAGTTTDRYIATSPTGNDAAVIQLGVQNNSPFPITGFNISYDIRRVTTVTTANELPGYWLFYSIDNGASWINVSALNPTLSTPGTVQVPNTVGTTSVPLTSVSITSGAVTAGSYLLFRWVDDNANQTSPDQIIGLDNVSIQPIARGMRLNPVTTASPVFTVNGGGNGNYGVTTYNVGGLGSGSIDFRMNPATTSDGVLLVALDLSGTQNAINALIAEFDLDGADIIDPVFGSGYDMMVSIPLRQSQSFFRYEWNFIGSGVTLNRIAVIPEPTLVGLFLPVATALASRRRR